MQEALGSIPAPHELGVVEQVYNPSTQKVETGGSEVQGHP